MDVYGYPSYQYGHSEELAKQIYTQQALGTSMPYDKPTESHIMPAPTGNPWNAKSLTWGLSSPPQVVEFTGQPQPITAPKISPVVHCKRKSLDVEPVVPAKQLITEEKMAAHLNSLHISADYTTHRLATEELMDVGMEDVGSNAASLISEKLKGHTIVLSEEVKKVQEEPLLPAALIDRLEKPRMSLVVWKPKEEIILGTYKEDKDKEKSETKEDSPKRNGLLVTEFPTMDIEM